MSHVRTVRLSTFDRTSQGTQGAAKRPHPGADPPQKLEAALQRIQRRRQSAYEDYQDALISKEDFLRYRADYDAQEQALQAQLDKLRSSAQDDPLALPWVKELLALGHLTELDRPTVAAAIWEISYVSMRETALRSTICSRRAATICWRGECIGVPFWVKRKKRAYRNVFNVRREKLVA